jgi:hypothetical protein
VNIWNEKDQAYAGQPPESLNALSFIVTILSKKMVKVKGKDTKNPNLFSPIFILGRGEDVR